MPDITETELVDSGAMPPSDFHEAIERLREIAEYDLEIPDDFVTRLDQAIDGLVVPKELMEAATAAVRVGHVIIQGPPGTGKSSLARALSKAYNTSLYAVTAHEDWTVYDVIGRLELRLTADRHEEIAPVNGALTEAVIRCGNNISQHFDDPVHPQAEWLFIDELNRAHIDKAFGELFSVIGTDDLVPINLPHQKEGNRELVIPRRFRIIATLNSYDKQFVQGLSQAIRRRFTFLSFDIPPKRNDAPWSFDLSSAIPAIKEFSVVMHRVASRVAQRESSLDPTHIPALQHDLLQSLRNDHFTVIQDLFSFIEIVRYATSDSEVPHLPIGTAQIIDTVELFLTRVRQDGGDEAKCRQYMDWAASVKLAPLFESDVLGPDQLTRFAQTLEQPFNRLMKRELLMIAASGVHFVPVP